MAEHIIVGCAAVLLRYLKHLLIVASALIVLLLLLIMPGVIGGASIALFINDVFVRLCCVSPE